MKKKFINALLMGALIVPVSTSLSSCYQDDLDKLEQRVDLLEQTTDEDMKAMKETLQSEVQNVQAQLEKDLKDLQELHDALEAKLKFEDASSPLGQALQQEANRVDNAIASAKNELSNLINAKADLYAFNQLQSDFNALEGNVYTKAQVDQMKDQLSDDVTALVNQVDALFKNENGNYSGEIVTYVENYIANNVMTEITRIEGLYNTLNAAFTATKAALEAKDIELDGKIALLDDEVAAIKLDLSTKYTELKDKIEANTAAIAQNKTDINTNKDNIAANATQILANQERLTSLEAFRTSIYGLLGEDFELYRAELAKIQKNIDDITTINGEIAAINTTLTGISTRIDGLYEAELQAKVLVDIQNGINAYVAANITPRFEAIEANVTALKEDLRDLKAGINAAIKSVKFIPVTGKNEIRFTNLFAKTSGATAWAPLTTVNNEAVAKFRVAPAAATAALVGADAKYELSVYSEEVSRAAHVDDNFKITKCEEVTGQPGVIQVTISAKELTNVDPFTVCLQVAEKAEGGLVNEITSDYFMVEKGTSYIQEAKYVDAELAFQTPYELLYQDTQTKFAYTPDIAKIQFSVSPDMDGTGAEFKTVEELGINPELFELTFKPSNEADFKWQNNELTVIDNAWNHAGKESKLKYDITIKDSGFDPISIVSGEEELGGPTPLKAIHISSYDEEEAHHRYPQIVTWNGSVPYPSIESRNTVPIFANMYGVPGHCATDIATVTSVDPEAKVKLAIDNTDDYSDFTLDISTGAPIGTYEVVCKVVNKTNDRRHTVRGEVMLRLVNTLNLMGEAIPVTYNAAEQKIAFSDEFMTQVYDNFHLTQDEFNAAEVVVDQSPTSDPSDLKLELIDNVPNVVIPAGKAAGTYSYSALLKNKANDRWITIEGLVKIVETVSIDLGTIEMIYNDVDALTETQIPAALNQQIRDAYFADFTAAGLTITDHLNPEINFELDNTNNAVTLTSLDVVALGEYQLGATLWNATTDKAAKLTAKLVIKHDIPAATVDADQSINGIINVPYEAASKQLILRNLENIYPNFADILAKAETTEKGEVTFILNDGVPAEMAKITKESFGYQLVIEPSKYDGREIKLMAKVVFNNTEDVVIAGTELKTQTTYDLAQSFQWPNPVTALRFTKDTTPQNIFAAAMKWNNEALNEADTHADMDAMNIHYTIEMIGANASSYFKTIVDAKENTQLSLVDGLATTENQFEKEFTIKITFKNPWKAMYAPTSWETVSYEIPVVLEAWSITNP